MNSKLDKLKNLNKKLKPSRESSGVFLPKDSRERFNFMFVAEMPSMNKPEEKSNRNKYPNFSRTTRDKFLQEMMVKYGVAGSYVTDIVKAGDRPRQPTEKEIQKWLPFLLKEIEIIRPKAIVVLGRRTYEASFGPFIEPRISKEIKVDYALHYSSQVPKNKFERRFGEVIKRMRNSK